MSEASKIMDYVVSGVIAFLSGLSLYHFKKIGEIPEKYISKEDFRVAKDEIRQDIKGIHDRLDKLFEPK